jgi:hypothetical protein
MGCFIALIAGAVVVGAYAFVGVIILGILGAICELWPWILGGVILLMIMGVFGGK